MGRLKRASLRGREHEPMPGVMVHLRHEGSPRAFILAAHVDQDQWLCHSGGLVDVSFNVTALLTKDIVLEAVSKMDAWAACFVEATWKAEIIRAERCAFDLEGARVGYKSNPFRWHAEGRFSHSELTFAWSWMRRGEWRRMLITARALDLTAHGTDVLLPTTLRCDDDAALADVQWVTRDMPLCKYLGCWQKGWVRARPG